MDVYNFKAMLKHSKNIHSSFIYISALQENSIPDGSKRQKASTLISVTYIHNLCKCVSLFSLTQVVNRR